MVGDSDGVGMMVVGLWLGRRLGTSVGTVVVAIVVVIGSSVVVEVVVIVLSLLGVVVVCRQWRWGGYWLVWWLCCW